MRWIMAGAVALLIAGIATVAAATSQTAETEVRIVAAQQEDGRVAFALQQRQADDTWGERILPAQNMFPAPADATVGRWLSSSPVTVAVEVEGPESFGAWRALEREPGDSPIYHLQDENRAGIIMLFCSPEGAPLTGVLTDKFLLNDLGTDRVAVTYWYAGGEVQAELWESTEEYSLENVIQSSVIPQPPVSGSVPFVTWLVSQYTEASAFFFSVAHSYGASYSGTFTVTGLHAVADALPCLTAP